jgi:serine/threonine protein kinase
LISNKPIGFWMLPAHVGGSRSMIATLQRDFAQLRKLEHPHVERMVELGCNGQQYYVTGERLDGEPLREVLNHLLPERLDVGEADDIVRAVGSALVYAHEQGVAHGAVRAENVLITMDRRIVLTNFLARRVAKVASRSPRPIDDLKGLARLAAELYVGSTSPDALRAAVHAGVPAKRVHAIRAVLEPASRRTISVADFLDAADLPEGAVATAQPAERPHRSWSIWRLVFPIAAIAAVASFAVSYRDIGGAAAEEMTARGLEVLRAAAARLVPPPAAGPVQRDAGPQDSATVPIDLEEAVGATPPVDGEADALQPEAVEQATPQPAGAHSPPPVPIGGATTALAARPRRLPTNRAVLSLGTPKIAAREDHSVVAIDIVRSGDTTFESAVGWWTTPDTAHEEDDYAGIGRQTVTFRAGATVERVLIPIVNDAVREPEEQFTVHLSRPRGAVVGAVTATRVTLHDDD